MSNRKPGMASSVQGFSDFHSSLPLFSSLMARNPVLQAVPNSDIAMAGNEIHRVNEHVVRKNIRRSIYGCLACMS